MKHIDDWSKVSPEWVAQETRRIKAMGREMLRSLWVCSPIGHPYFDTAGPLDAVMTARRKEVFG